MTQTDHPYAQYARLFSLLGNLDAGKRQKSGEREALEAEVRRMPHVHEFRGACAFNLYEVWCDDRITGAHNRKQTWIKLYRVFRKQHPRLPKAIEIQSDGRSGSYVITFADERRLQDAKWKRLLREHQDLGIPDEEFERLQRLYGTPSPPPAPRRRLATPLPIRLSIRQRAGKLRLGVNPVGHGTAGGRYIRNIRAAKSQTAKQKRLVNIASKKLQSSLQSGAKSARIPQRGIRKIVSQTAESKRKNIVDAHQLRVSVVRRRKTPPIDLHRNLPSC